MHSEKDFIASIEQHQKIIHKVCNLYLHDEQDKKDLFQEILLNAWKGYANFKGEAKFSTWLYRVALNTAITFYRKENRQVTTTALPDTFVVAADFNTTGEEQLTVMYKLINELSGIDKALVMLYIEDYSHTEIGELLGISANHAAVKINRVKLKLKETAQKYL